MTDEYFFLRDGQQSDPVSFADIQALLGSGKLSPTDLIWTEGMSDWKPAAEVPGLIPPTMPKAANSPQPAAAAAHSAPSTATAAPSIAAKSAADRCKQALDVAKTTALVTGRHLGRLVTCGIAKGKIRLANRDALRSQSALGQRMHGAGMGDEKKRRLIGELNERIQSLKAAHSSAKPVETELFAAYAALAEPSLAEGQSPPGLEAEFEAARVSRSNVNDLQRTADDARLEMRSMQTQQRLRIVAGYAVCILLLATITWAGFGSGNAGVPGGDTAHGGNGSTESGGEVMPVDLGTGDPTVFNPAPGTGNSNQQTTCYNCNGTGQSNCLQCFGTGKRTCFNCNGSGRTVNNMQCFQCNGSGRQNCSFCQFGKVQCPQCFGSGRR